MWWLSELGWAGLEDGLGWPPCRFSRILDSRLRGNDGGGGRIARMGGMPRALLSPGSGFPPPYRGTGQAPRE